MNIKKIEVYLDPVLSEKRHENGVEFSVDFILYHGQNLKFMKYIKNKIKQRTKNYKYLYKSKNAVRFGVIFKTGDELEYLKWDELFLSCMNKTYLLMISHTYKDWLFNMFVEIFLETDIDDSIEVSYGDNLVNLLLKQKNEK